MIESTDRDRAAPSGRWNVLIIVPAYNEADAIGGVIDRVQRHLPSAQILVVDDGSTDATARIARSRGARVASLPFNRGIGAAMQTGYLFAFREGFDVAVQLDGDGQHDPEQLTTLLEPILRGQADLVVGSRFLQVGGFRSTAARRIGIVWLALFISLLTGTPVSDPTSGYRAVNRSIIARFAFDYPTDYPEPEVIVSLRRQGFRVLEVPARMHPRQTGHSSITALRSIYYMVKVSLSIAIGMFRPARSG